MSFKIGDKVKEKTSGRIGTVKFVRTNGIILLNLSKSSQVNIDADELELLDLTQEATPTASSAGWGQADPPEKH